MKRSNPLARVLLGTVAIGLTNPFAPMTKFVKGHTYGVAHQGDKECRRRRKQLRLGGGYAS